MRRAIEEIVADTDKRCRPRLLWPAQDWDGWRSAKPLKTLYVGAAGVAWGLQAVRERGYAESTLDLTTVARRALDAWRERPGILTGLDQPQPAHASLFHGESGILVVLARLAPDRRLADDLYSRVRENAANEANEIFWGAPGTMLAAHAMHESTGEPRWAEAWAESAEELWRRRDAQGLWTQRLHGSEVRSLGTPHGLVGNTLALLQGNLSGARRRALCAGTAAVLERTAVRESGLANWPLAEGRSLVARDGEVRVQWCAGSPGIVVSTADYLDEELLLAGAELTWRVGPLGLDKGAGICHGTAGNGYAFLKVFQRTGDEVWLERARRFAVHALEQVRRLREARGRGRYSLFTGDVGTALYAGDCLAGIPRYPVLEGL